MRPAAKLLVVDDDDHVREALVEELSTNYHVHAACDGAAAIDMLGRAQYDVVISDLKMPGLDGIEVLDFVHKHQREAVRVLLTGYLDERAHVALLQPDAPYKVGKPWHDELEVTVRRGLEARDVIRQHAESIEHALGLATFDADLATTASAFELADLVVRRGLGVTGVISCGSVMRVAGFERPVAGGTVLETGAGWYLDLPLDACGDLRLKARGLGESARQLVSYMAHRAQRRCGVLEARVAPARELGVTGTRVDQLMRQATLGALTSSLLHDLASTVQALSAALSEVQYLAADNPKLAGAANEAMAAGDEATNLFVHMRKFIRAGQVDTRRVALPMLVERALKLAGGFVRERAKLRLGVIPNVALAVSEPLFLQVLCNLLRNAAKASPPNGNVDVAARLVGNEVEIAVTDDGPGVPEDIQDHMFEPFTTTHQDGTGLGLAISAFVMQSLGGRISYRRDPQRGACFTVTLGIVLAN